MCKSIQKIYNRDKDFWKNIVLYIRNMQQNIGNCTRMQLINEYFRSF